MDDVQFGALFLAARLRRAWRQVDVAGRAGVSRDLVAAIEHGQLDEVRHGDLRSVARVLEINVDLRGRWRGGEGARLLSAVHSALAEGFAKVLVGDGWEPHPETSFSIWGERGVIDVLAWHPATCTLLVVEIKTEILDVGEMLGTLDRKHRLAAQIARGLGLSPLTVGVCVILLDTRTNHRRLADHATTIRAALPADGRRLRGWLRHPDGPVAGQMFLPYAATGRTRLGVTGLKRVRRPRNPAKPAPPPSDPEPDAPPQARDGRRRAT